MMGSRCLRLLKTIRCTPIISSYNAIISQHNLMSTTSTKAKDKFQSNKDFNKLSVDNDFKTEKKDTFLDDPNTFGTLSRKTINKNEEEDEGDLKEEKYLQELPLKSQQLTTRQYADIIKQYLKHKRLKEALDVLEVRMIQEDRVKPENYIYNILIGACANVGYTKKAFKLYNDMKKRALKPTGDTYTCLFTACVNSPWIADGLKKARHLRALMNEKGIEPNLTNYNVMIKAFGRCGDLPTAFQIVDEMISKKIKIRVHTFNHLLQACITDKENGLKYALVVWRKMLKMREKPNVYSFNLMLKCVKDCNLGSKEDINELIGILEENMIVNFEKVNKPLQIEAPGVETSEPVQKLIASPKLSNVDDLAKSSCSSHSITSNVDEVKNDIKLEADKIQVSNELSVIGNQEKVTMELVDYRKNVPQIRNPRTVPNLLSKMLQMDQVFALQDVHTLQDRFAVVGGQDDFLKEMEAYLVKPDIKIFTQMLPLIDNTTEAEIKLIEAMEAAKVVADIDFYNLLIRKRCLRLDYDKALEVKDMITKDSKKRHPLNKKRRLKENIMTYGVLAMACRSKESAEKLLNEMKEKQIKVNIQILGTLLKHGTVNIQFDYVKYIMNVVKEEKVELNDVFLQHLEAFSEKCATIIKEKEEKGAINKPFYIAYNSFLQGYKKWLADINAEEALKTEHPWQQFREPYPETVQRSDFKIKEPKKFYKRNRKFVMYAPQVK
ncbi:pentatricopeptide repeat-containing protein 1, mitochondrial [Epargyreus clarus]|uniref:pentatricopeptide repeat-containing protein 1, mitochondrial n=1 Tax=Epargyreus clarus TaxID=520877 RepID=UPI003C2DE355